MRKYITSKSHIVMQIQSPFSANKNNTKKGFTMVELVVVIAIIAIMSAIAIPVVSYTIKSSMLSRAKTNANTIEYALKEADAAIIASDNTKYANASTNNIMISDVVSKNGLSEAMQPEILFGTTYCPVICNSKVYFATDLNSDGKYDANDKTIDGTNLPDDAIALYSTSTNSIVDVNISSLNLSNK